MKFDGNNCNQLNAHWKISSKNKLVYLFVWFLNTNGFIYNNVMVFFALTKPHKTYMKKIEIYLYNSKSSRIF